jgi:hypothetical protein
VKRKLGVVIGIVVLALVVYLFVLNNESNHPQETEPENVKQLVQEYSASQTKNESASITSEQLIVTDSSGSETTYPLPQDEFFVSIAPYIENTHPCAIHSLTGCQGELIEKQFNVYIEDQEGNVVVNQMLTSQANGFIDLWLPRDKAYKATIEYEGKAAETEFSTFADDDTCITTIQLNENKSA